MRLIDADAMKELWQGCEIKGSIAPLLDVRPTINAIPIPDNATNGYVLKAVFPDITFTPNDTSLMDDMFEGGFEPDSIYTDLDNGFWLTKKWWDAPYKKTENML